MKVITYRIKLLEPALVTKLDGDPNSAVAHDYLPGSVLRGALISAYLRARKKEELDAHDHDERALFLNNHTRYLNGYPVVDGVRALPAPLSWAVVKGNRTPIYNLALTEPPMNDALQPETMKGLGSPFWTFTGQQIRLFAPRRQINIHTARSRVYGRARADDGAVYRYEALADGQTFEAAILCERDQDATSLFDVLKNTKAVSLGGSRTGGYGRAELGTPRVADATGWREVNGKTPEVQGTLVVTLLSDALIRDAYGQFTNDVQTIELLFQKRLGLSGKMDTTRSVMRGNLVGGFNRKWGLPLPQSLAVSSGSTFVFHDVAVTPKVVQELELSGVGERLAEGFGRTAVNWALAETYGVAEEMAVQPRRGTPKLYQLAASEPLAMQMVERMTRRFLDEKVIELAHSYRFSGSPSRSQLSRLRAIIQDELYEAQPDLKRISDFLGDIESRKSARTQFERVRIDREPIMAWIRRQLPAAVEVWEFREGMQLDESLHREYSLRLIDAMLAKMARDKQQDEEADHDDR